MEIEYRIKVQPHQVIPSGNWHTCVLLAGRGAGKTWNEARWLITQALTYPDTTWMAVGRTWAECIRVLAEGEGGLRWQIMGGNGGDNLEALLDGGSWDKAFSRSPGRAELRFANGSVIRLGSADRPASLRGTNAHGSVGDEVAFWPEEALNQLRLITRLKLPDGTPSRILMATTPDGENWWSRQWLKKAPMPGVVYVGSNDPTLPPDPPPSSFANAHTDESWKSSLVSMYEGTDLYEQEVLGMVLNARGQIYKGLSQVKNSRGWRCDESLDEPLVWPTPDTAEEVIAGQDLGTEHPSALIILARVGTTWCAVAEVVKPAATEQDWYDMIAPTLALWRPHVVWSDVNFPQTTNQQRRRGLPVKDTTKGPTSVMEGIRTVQGVISSGSLVVDLDACPKLWQELNGYRWAVDAKGDPVEKPVKKNDDAADALRYALFMASTKPKKRARFAGRADLESQMDYETGLIQGMPSTLTIGPGSSQQV